MLDQPPADPPPAPREDPFAVRPRPRPSVLRVLGIAIGSIVVTGLAFRAFVELVRMAMSQ